MCRGAVGRVLFTCPLPLGGGLWPPLVLPGPRSSLGSPALWRRSVSGLWTCRCFERIICSKTSQHDVPPRPWSERAGWNSFASCGILGHFCGVAPDRRASVPTPNFCEGMATECRGFGLTVSAVATNLLLHACLCDRMAFTLQAKVS